MGLELKTQKTSSANVWNQEVPDFPLSEVPEIPQVKVPDGIYLRKRFPKKAWHLMVPSSNRPMEHKAINLSCDLIRSILMSGALKDISGADIWRRKLETLRKEDDSNQDKLENLMADVLKFCYEHLPDDRTRKCLRNCAFLYGNNNGVPVFYHFLIESWIEDGIVSEHEEGGKILRTLINFNLLSRVNGSSVKMVNEHRILLLDHIFLLEEIALLLIQGSMGLKIPPKFEEWERLKGIYLIDNQLSELPVNPSCPRLHSLFLERNYKLRTIPPLFFEDMPQLQVLNLSRTSIKFLPESLFKLVNLRRLFLCHCNLITTLSPKVGQLKQLEVLDLEGTEIMYLPAEVGQLTKLICLEVSFFEPMSKRRSEEASSIIPGGVISDLSMLQELNIDVGPDDKRWNASAEMLVSEICKLRELSTLKFYFPKAELLSYFNWHGNRGIASLFHFGPLSSFKVTVGHISKRVISRLPHDTEFELERHDRYLKYVNGEDIPEDIKNVLKFATAFFLDRHSTIRTLSKFGCNMLHLKCCVAGECNELQAIVDEDQIEMESSGDGVFSLFSLEYLYIFYMKNLRSICRGQLKHKDGFWSLKYLTLHTCPELTTIFTPILLFNLWNLEELTINDCPQITSLISCNVDEQANINGVLPSLKRISLHFLPKLASISSGLLISPTLELMSFRYCPNLKSIPISKDANPNLRKIKGELRWWQELKWESTQQHSWNDIFEAVNKFN